MESSDFLESTHPYEEDRRRSFFDFSSQRFVFFSILCVLFKSEAIFTFFVCWLRGLALTTGTIKIPTHNTLSHLWLLKPIFCLIIDLSNVSISQTNDGMDFSGKASKVQNRRRPNFLFFRISNYRVVILILSEYTMALCSVLLYILYKINCLNTYCTNILAYTLTLSLVCASAYGEGLFSRYIRGKGENTYLKSVAERLSLSSFYGYTTFLFLMFPVMFPDNKFGELLQLNSLFPLFLVFNAVFVSWLISRPVVSSHVPNSNALSPTASQVDISKADSENFSIQVLLSLFFLLVVSFRLKNDFYNRYKFSDVDQYVYLLFTQLFKLITSLFTFYFMSTRTLLNLSMGIFGTCLLLLYPLKSYTLRFFDNVVRLGTLRILLLGSFLSFIQQILMTYGLVISLFITHPGYEATTLSIPSFSAHLTHLCFRQRVIDYLEMSKKQIWACDILGIFFFSYCFSVLFNKDHPNFLEKFKKSLKILGDENQHSEFTNN
uniref:Uncharacterized protein n=1 Tax=Theileria parva TaxID=5875 RepID=Q4N0G2_THEPA|eukprot:XP_763200.1 hypothetical protein [Theileria parva strain Muguga]